MSKHHEKLTEFWRQNKARLRLNCCRLDFSKTRRDLECNLIQINKMDQVYALGLAASHFDTLRHFALMSHCVTLSDDGNFIQMPYMVETRLHSNSNNLELHEAGNACWVLHLPSEDRWVKKCFENNFLLVIPSNGTPTLSKKLIPQGSFKAMW